MILLKARSRAAVFMLKTTAMNLSAKLKVSFLLFSVTGLTAIPTIAWGQQGQSQSASKEVRIKITQTEGGKTTSEVQTQTVNGNPNLSDLLMKYGFSDELGDMADGEAVEIIIRRKLPSSQAESKVIEVEPVVKKVEPVIAATPAPAPKPAATRTLATDKDFAYLGVKYNDLPINHPIMADLPEVRGAMVDVVLPGTSAEENGLRPGDVIAAVDDIHFTEEKGIHDLISQYKAGDPVRLTYYRNNHKRTVDLVLGGVGKNPVYQYGYDNGSGKVRMEATNQPVAQKEEESRLTNSINAAGPMKEEAPYANVPAADRAFLGVNGEAGQDDEIVGGAIVASILRNSTGEALGLQKGDMIISLNGAPIRKFSDLGATLAYIAPGDVVTLEYIRNEEMQNASARILTKKETYQARPQASQPEVTANVQKTAPSAQPVKWEVYNEVKMTIVLKDATAQEAESISGRSGMDISAQNSLNIKDLNMFPNPNEGIFTLTFQLPESGDTEIRFLDSNGKLMYAEDLPGFSGNYEKQLDFSDREKGIYFLRIVQSGQPMLKKIVLQ